MKDKDVLLRLSEQDYRTVQWLAEKLNLSISQCLRAFIPRIEPPEAKRVTDVSEIGGANPDDLVPVQVTLQQSDLDELSGILRELRQKKWAVTLANEIQRQLIDNKEKEKSLTVSTYKRLSRWGTPYRWAERERYVKPRAKRIAEILFGRGIDRVG